MIHCVHKKGIMFFTTFKLKHFIYVLYFLKSKCLIFIGSNVMYICTYSCVEYVIMYSMAYYRGSPLSTNSLSTIPVQYDLKSYQIIQIPRYSTIFLQKPKKSGQNSVEKSHQNSKPSTSGQKILQIINCGFSIMNQICKAFDSINDEDYLGC